MELELPRNNLYAAGYIVALQDNEGLLLRKPLELKGSEQDVYYTVKQGDMLDAIAWKQYANVVEDASKYWWVIADANSIQNPLDIEYLIGQNILIPNILNVLLTLE